MRAADAGLGDLDDRVGDERGQPAEDRAVDLERLEVAGVDADDAAAGVEGALQLDLVVDLDQGRHAQALGALDQRDEGLLLERCDDEQGDVGAVRPALPQLVGRHDEVLAQQRHRDASAYGVQVGQAPAEAALLGEDADDRGAPGLVVLGQRGRVGDRRQRALGRAAALDLRDDRHAESAQDRLGVQGRRLGRSTVLELVQARAGLPLGQVLPHADEDVVEHAHAGVLLVWVGAVTLAAGD